MFQAHTLLSSCLVDSAEPAQPRNRAWTVSVLSALLWPSAEVSHAAPLDCVLALSGIISSSFFLHLIEKDAKLNFRFVVGCFFYSLLYPNPK